MSMNQPTDDTNDRQIARIEPKVSAPAEVDQFTDERVKLIRETVAKGAPDDVFRAMIDIARTRGLDPMAKQIGVAQFDKNAGYQIYMPIDGYRAVAGDHPDFGGKDRPEYGPVIGNTPMGKPYPEWCAVTVYRIVQGQRVPFTAEVWWEGFYGGERNRSWNKMPRVMLAKVAEAHALRMAFTRSLSGTYTPDEMDQASVEVQGRVVNQSTGEIRPQTRQDAPGRTEPAIEASPDHATAMRALHAEARKHDIDHDGLHTIAQGMGKSSLKEFDAAHLQRITQRIKDDPEATRQYIRAAQKPHAQAELTEAPDDIDDQIEAALANATPNQDGDEA